MKIGFIFSGLFWGILVILIGIGISVNIVFNIDIPVGKLILAIILIGAGLTVLLKGLNPEKAHNIIFSHSSTTYVDGITEYNVLFAQGDIDLSKLPFPKENIEIELNCIFGQARVYIDSSLPLTINMSAAFSEADTLENSKINFGDSKYQTPSFKEEQPHYSISTNVVFGALSVRNKAKAS